MAKVKRQEPEAKERSSFIPEPVVCHKCKVGGFGGKYDSDRLGPFGEAHFERLIDSMIYLTAAELIDAKVCNDQPRINDAMTDIEDLAKRIQGNYMKDKGLVHLKTLEVGEFFSTESGRNGTVMFTSEGQVTVKIEGVGEVGWSAFTLVRRLKDLPKPIRLDKETRSPKEPAVKKAMTGVAKVPKDELYKIASKATGRSIKDLEKQCIHPTNKGLEVMRLRNIINAANPKD